MQDYWKFPLKSPRNDPSSSKNSENGVLNEKRIKFYPGIIYSSRPWAPRYEHED